MTTPTAARNEPATAPAGREGAQLRRRRFHNFSDLHGRALVVRYILLIAVLIVMLGPLALPLMAAFKSSGEPIFGQAASLLPEQWSLDAFRTMFAQTNMLRYILNSLIVCALSVGSALLLATVGGYMLSRKGWRGRTLVFFVVMSALIFPFESIMLSLYAQVQAWDLYDTLVGVWVPSILGPFHLLLMRAAFLGIPDEIEDASFVDGATEMQRFLRIFLPQVKGSLVVVGLTAFIFAWQDFLWPLLVIQSDDNMTMMLGISRLQGSFGTDYRVVLAGAITAMLPVVITFFFTQRYFFRGIEEGGLKF